MNNNHNKNKPLSHTALTIIISVIFAGGCAQESTDSPENESQISRGVVQSSLTKQDNLQVNGQVEKQHLAELTVQGKIANNF